MGSANPSLPQDQSLRIYTKNQRLVILSVAENGLDIGKGTGYTTFKNTGYVKGVLLFTEKLTVKSNVEAPCGLTAATWTLVGAEEGVNLDASGISGGVGTSSSPNGQPGGNGGTLGVYVQDLDDTAAKAFTFLARGGGGGDVYDSKAKVGDGGDGGVITSVLQPTYSRVLKSIQRYKARSEFQDEKNRDSVVSKTDSLYLAAKELLSVGQGLSASNDTITNVFGKLQAAVDSEDSITVDNLRRGANSATHKIKNLILDQGNSVAPSPDDVRLGHAGVGIGVQVPAGKDGKAGELQPTFLADVSSIADSLVRVQLPFAHPEQCGMLLERANIFFYMGSQSLRDHAKALYQRLLERLSFLLVLKSSDPLYQAYQAYQNSEIIQPTWLDDLKSIRQSASTQLIRLESGKSDYYGHSLQWAPRQSYTSYKSFLDGAFAGFKSFEDAYIQYHIALEKQESLKDKVKLASDNTSAITSSLSEDIKELWEELRDLDKQIKAMKFVVEAARSELSSAYEKEKAKIDTAFGLSIPQLINALTSIASAPPQKVRALQAVDLIYQGFTSVPTIDGGTVTKEYLASEIRRSEATITNIKLELEKKIDGTYQLDEAFSKRLLLEKEQLFSELDKFSEKALSGVNDANTRKALKDKFNAYVDAVTKRDDFIFRYNVNVNLLQKKSEEKAEYIKKEEELKHEEVTVNDPNLSAITAYVDAIYQSSRLRVMKLLDILSCSLNFRTPDSSSVTAFTLGSENPQPDNVPLSLTYTTLTAARDSIEKKFSKVAENWGSAPIRFPSDRDNSPGKYVQGKRYCLAEAYRKQLINSHSVALTIPPVRKDTKPELAGDFGRCCNVRVYRARFGFTGLKTTSEVKDDESVRVQVNLTHSGNETIINRSDNEFVFEHDPIPTIFSFYLHKDGSMTVGEDGNIADADINNTDTSYAAPGPFAEWTVDLTYTQFDKLDFSGVTAAYFDFSGTNYSF